MHVTKWGEYGILCSVFLAKRYLNSESVSVAEGDLTPQPVGALEVAQAQGIPAQYTQQILQRLRRGDIVKSIRGAHGGYVLSRHPSKITLLDIMTAAEGSTFDVMCETSPAYPTDGTPHECVSSATIGGCNLKDVWFEVRSAIDQVLTRRTLESLITNSGNEAELPNQLIQISKVSASLSDR